MTSRFPRHVSLRPWMLALVGLILAAALVTVRVKSADASPNIRKADIASVPLYAATQGDKPALALALSVEFPTVGAQYRDANYSPSIEYIGYYNAETCYRYVDNPSDAPTAGKTKADYKRFQMAGAASARQCGDGFSGNFLNWASSSAIDMLRMALSGGDRSIDEDNLTILQRAVLPNGDPVCFWNSSSYFPAKQLTKGADGKYSGAVPQAMVTAASGSSIWVANTLNQIFFGTSNTGSCTDASAYRLGAAVNLGPVTSGKQNIPTSAIFCAVAGGICATTGTQTVWYGPSTSSDPKKPNTTKVNWNKAQASGSITCSDATFGKNSGATACFLTPGDGSFKPTPGLNSDGFFYARVEVCGADGSGKSSDDRDYGLCTRYPNGSYKPTGTVQKYSDQLRLAAFGYALEQTLSWNGSTNGRYGGVLRAPMKFVGSRTYDQNGTETTPKDGNPRKEWDQTTGIFVENPEKDGTFNISGVINYLNQFGRTGDKPGRYKQYDPASELYYETLRYLQGLPPSASAVANLDLGNKAQKDFYDGYPIYTDWTNLDPFGSPRSSKSDYSCVRNNIALIGDVNTHDSIYYGKSRMPTVDTANNIPDIAGWISVVKAFETGKAVAYLDGQGKTRTTSNPNTPSSGANTRGPEVYGLAYWAHTHDIRGSGWTNKPDLQRPGLRVKSFFFDVNENSTESDANRRRYNNQYFTAAKYGGFNTQPSGDATVPYNIQGNPFYDQNGNASNNVWQNPATPAEAQTYFLQSNARGVLSAFDKIFSEASSAERSIAGAAASTGNLTQAGSFAYQASFDTSNWSGDVQAFSVSVGTDNTTINLAKHATWSADQQLAARVTTGSSARNIFVGYRAANSNPAASSFTTSTIEVALQEDLKRYSAAAPVDGLWQERVNYLRGDKSKEGSPFRIRMHAMGDVVNSGIAYVGAPGSTQNMGAGYSAFVTAYKGRKPAVYAGANDGMLHAFDASTGDELFAYIPSWVGANLAALTDPGYVHQAYVDATPVVGDAQTGAASTSWKTVLVSGSGGGGRGVFALDVTDPSNFDASNVMWEFTPANDPDMGYVLGKPRIVKLRTDDLGATTTPTYRWFAMVPAGVNSYVPDGNGVFSTTGAPTIFLLALDKPAGTAWTNSGSAPNYYKISLPFDATLAVSNPTGIINLEAFMNGSGITQYVYAGDLHGRLWALDFTRFGASGWTSGGLSRFSTGSGSSAVAYPMYVAKDASGNLQPITAAPTVVQGANEDQYFVAFGTGKYFENSDARSTQANTYYALYDNGKSGDTSGVAGIAGRGRLQALAINASGKLAPTSPFVWGRATSNGDTTQRSGWYYDLPTTGERVTHDGTYVPVVNKVLFSSLIPESATSPGVCSVSGGTGNTYYVDLLAATGVKVASTVGVLGQPMIAFNDPGTTETSTDSTGRRLRTRPMVVTQQGSKGLDAQQLATESYPVGRLSWRQVNNYLQLHKQ